MPTNLVRIPILVATGAAGVILLAACSSSSSPADNSTAAAPPTSAAPAGSGKTVTAVETEFHIALSSMTLSAGTYTFKVKNSGKITHALSIDGPGVDDKSTGDLSAGASGTVTVTLKAGSYDVFCPVGDHKAEGMDETLKVT